MTDQATHFVTLAGRDILFRQPLPGQLIMLRRRLLRLQQEANSTVDEKRRLELGNQLVIDTLTLVESLIVDPQDAQFLEESMLVGKVGHEEVMAVLAKKPEDDKPAKKTARKTPAKAVANHGRTKR